MLSVNNLPMKIFPILHQPYLIPIEGDQIPIHQMHQCIEVVFNNIKREKKDKKKRDGTWSALCLHFLVGQAYRNVQNVIFDQEQRDCPEQSGTFGHPISTSFCFNTPV